MANQPALSTRTGNQPLVQLDGVGKSYERGAEQLYILRSVSLDVERQDFIALMGPSGSGKSTLLNIVGGIDEPSSGSVLIDGANVYRLSDAERARWRARNIGFIFQLYHLHPAFTAEQNVMLPLRLFRMSAEERRRRARTALSLVGLAERMRHRPGQLSGGQQQRVAIARAIVTDPTLLLCDEPTGNLDREARDEILTLLRLLNGEHGKTIIMVTHDAHAAAQAKRTLYVNKGTLGEAPER